MVEPVIDILISMAVAIWILLGMAAVSYDDVTVVNLVTKWPEDYVLTLPWYNVLVAILLPFVAWPVALNKRKAYLIKLQKCYAKHFLNTLTSRSA